MIDTSKHNAVNTKLHEIKSGYIELLSTDEPILYFGINSLHNHVIGSLLDADDEAELEQHLHSLISPNIYLSYILGERTYRDVLSEAEQIFLLESTYNLSEIRVFLINYSSIPEDYLPTDDSYCPQYTLSKSEKLAVHLEGGLADQHVGRPKKIAEIQTTISNCLGLVQKELKYCNVHSEVLQQAYLPGSFDIQFTLSYASNFTKKPVKKQRNTQEEFDFIQGEQVEALFRLFLVFCIETLPDTIRNLLGDDEQHRSSHYSELTRIVKEIAKLAGVKTRQIEKRLFNAIMKCALKLGALDSDFGDSYDRIYFVSGSSTESTQWFSYIDEAKFDKIQSTANIIKNYHQKIDPEPKLYEFFVHQFNTVNGKGKGTSIVDDKNHFDFEVKLEGKGIDNEIRKGAKYTGSSLAMSLAKGQRVKVLGIGTYVTGELDKLVVREFEQV